MKTFNVNGIELLVEDKIKEGIRNTVDMLAEIAKIDIITEKTMEDGRTVGETEELRRSVEASLDRIKSTIKSELEAIGLKRAEWKENLAAKDINIINEGILRQGSFPVNSSHNYLSIYLDQASDIPNLPLRRRSSMRNQTEILNISAIVPKLARKKSMGDSFREYRARLWFKFEKIPTNFNISFCSCKFGPNEFLLGIKNKNKKQELVKLNMKNKSCTNIMKVGLIIDILAFGGFIVMAERNEDIKIYRNSLMIYTLKQPFQAHYYGNAYGNDSRILHMYKEKRLYYITDTNKIVEYDLQKCFTEKIIDPPKKSFFECICVLDDWLYIVTIKGEVFQYSILNGKLENVTQLNFPDCKFCTVVSCKDILIVSGLSEKHQKNLVILLSSSLEILQELEMPNMIYPIHKIITFTFFGYPTVAMLYKHTGSTIYLFGLYSNQLKKLVEIPPFSSMMYDMIYHEDKIVLCGWEEKDEIHILELKIKSLDSSKY